MQLVIKATLFDFQLAAESEHCCGVLHFLHLYYIFIAAGICNESKYFFSILADIFANVVVDRLNWAYT